MRYDSDVLFSCRVQPQIEDFPMCLCTSASVKAAPVPMSPDPAAGEASDDSASVSDL